MKYFFKYFYFGLFALYVFTFAVQVSRLISGKEVVYYKICLSLFLLLFFLYNAIKYGEDD